MAVKESQQKNPAAVTLGRKGGKKGGLARALKLTAEQRSEIARNAVKARWARVNASQEAVVMKKSRKEVDAIATVSTNAKREASDRAVLLLLEQIKATNDQAKIRELTNELERVIFHKQYRTL